MAAWDGENSGMSSLRCDTELVLQGRCMHTQSKNENDASRICGQEGRCGMCEVGCTSTPQIVPEHRDHEFVWQIFCALPSAHTKLGEQTLRYFLRGTSTCR